MSTEQSRGFGIAAIIVVTVIGVAAFIAWRFSSATNNSSSTDNSSAENTQDNNQLGQTQADQTKYLVLTELGIKIKLDEKTKDLSYIHDAPTDDRADGVWIINQSMKALDEANQYCTGPTAGKIGRIDKSSDSHYWSAAALTVDNETSFKLGEFYYVFRPLQSECSQDTAMAEQRAAYVSDFKAVLPTIQVN